MTFKSLAALTSASALLLAMSAGPALADSASPSVSQTQTNQVTHDNGNAAQGPQNSQITGSAASGATGNIGLNAAAGTSNAQANDLVMESASGTNTLSSSPSLTQHLTNVGTGVGNQNSSSDTSTLDNSGPAAAPQGNYGANTAAGNSNEQINIVTLSAKPVGTDSMTSNQTIDGNGTTTLAGSTYSSSITAPALTGNGGFNSAAGDKNLQANSLQLFTTTGTSPGSASVNLTQTINGDTVNLGSGTYTSTVGGSALSNTTGNVGINGTAGASNIQNNTTLITDKTPLSPVNGSLSSSISGTNDGGSASQSATISPVSGTGHLAVNNAAGDHHVQMNLLIVGDPPPAPVTQTFTQSSTSNTAALSAPSGGNTSSISGGGGSGDVELNSTVGSGNQQLNYLNTVVGDATTITQTVNQSISGDTGQVSGVWNSNVTGTTATGASGNVGVDSASGVQNLQANGAVVVTGGADSVTQSFNPTIGADANGNPTVGVVFFSLGSNFTPGVSSTVDGSTAYQATGNVGINSASGVQNVQANGLVIVSGTSPVTASAAGSTQQMPDAAHTGATINGAEYTLGFTFAGASIGDQPSSGPNGTAASYVSGKLGINSAAGVQNVQNNAAALYTGNVTGMSSDQNYSQSTTTAAAGPVNSNPSQLFLDLNGAAIQGDAGRSNSGLTEFNAASGAQNLQSNAATIFRPSTGGTQSTSTQSQQTVTGDARASLLLVTNTAQLGVANGFSQTSNVGRDASGVITMNVAAGAGNQQQNLTTLVDVSDTGTPTASLGANPTPTISAQQTQNGLAVSDASTNSAQTGGSLAFSTDHAFENAKGVISANNAAGGYNQQANVVLVTAGNLGDIAPAVAPQTNNGATLTSQTTNTSALTGNAFKNAGGAIGANNAAGVANQQVNNTVIVQH